LHGSFCFAGYELHSEKPERKSLDGFLAAHITNVRQPRDIQKEIGQWLKNE